MRTHKDCDKTGTEEDVCGDNPGPLLLTSLQHFTEGREGWAHRGTKTEADGMGMLCYKIESFMASEANIGSKTQLGPSLAL